MFRKKNPWEQGHSPLIHQGEYGGCMLRIWQWIVSILIAILMIGLFVVDLLNVDRLLVEMPNWMHVSGPLLFVLLLLPYGGLQRLVGWFECLNELRRGDQSPIMDHRLGITTRLLVYVVNAVCVSWLLFFKDYRFHIENDLTVVWQTLIVLMTFAFVILVLLDREWFSRRTMIWVMVAGVMLIYVLYITFKWWWVFTGRAICPEWIPINFCNL